MVLDSEPWRIHSYFPGPCSEWCSFCRVIFGRNPVAKDCIYPNIIKPGEKFLFFYQTKGKGWGSPLPLWWDCRIIQWGLKGTLKITWFYYSCDAETPSPISPSLYLLELCLEHDFWPQGTGPSGMNRKWGHRLFPQDTQNREVRPECIKVCNNTQLGWEVGW